MVDCSDCRTLLVDFERGELDAARDAAMHAHLASCPACHHAWEADLGMVDAIRVALPERDFPTSILAGVRQAMYAESAPQPSFLERLRVILRPVVAAPIAAALIVGGFFVTHRTHETSQANMSGIDFVREHVAQTADMPSSDRTWSTYILTSANDTAGSGADATPAQ